MASLHLSVTDWPRQPSPLLWDTQVQCLSQLTDVPSRSPSFLLTPPVSAGDYRLPLEEPLLGFRECEPVVVNLW